MLIAVASAGDSKGTNTKDNMKSLEKKGKDSKILYRISLVFELYVRIVY